MIILAKGIATIIKVTFEEVILKIYFPNSVNRKSGLLKNIFYDLPAFDKGGGVFL